MALTRRDWYAIRFYKLVADQVTSNMTPDLKAYEIVLKIEHYPEIEHGWLMKTASLLHRLMSKQELIDWQRECGKHLSAISIEDIEHETS